EIEARGEKAQLAYQSALKYGAVNVYRGRVLLIGQDRAGKTSLKKSLIGLPFNSKEKSTDGIEVDPSKFQLDVGEVRNWQPIDERKQGLLGCSRDVAQMVVEKMYDIPVSRAWVQEEERGEAILQNDYNKNRKQVDTYGEKEEVSLVNQVCLYSVSELTLTEPDHELVVDTTSPPEEIKDRAVNLIKYMKGDNVKPEESVVSIELWDFAGQHLYYASHPVFLSSRALYILVCNLRKSLHDTAKPCVRQGSRNVDLENPNGETNLENLLSWLSTEELFFPSNFQRPWLIFEKVINALLSKPVYYLSVTKLRTHAKEKCFINDHEGFTTMVNFYHDLGIIIKHRSTVILSTQWLIDLFGQLITIPDFEKIFFIKQRNQTQQISVDDTSEVAVQVRKFVEATLQVLSRDLYKGGLQYQIRVACPYCQREKCSSHNKIACSHEDCLHLLELRQGDPLICKKKPAGEVLTVTGQEQWFSRIESKEACTPSSSPDTAQARPERLVLKVTLLANEWGSSKGGLSTINRTLAVHLAKDPHVEVTILVPEFECGEEHKRAAKSHNICIREAGRLPAYSDPLDWLIVPPEDLDIQIVIGHGAKLGRQAQIITKSHCCKWVQVVHTEPEELAMHKNYPSAIAKGEEKNRAEVDLCQIADLVVAVGPKLKEAIACKLRSSHRDIFQLIPGSFAELSDIEHGAEDGVNFRVLTFGRGDLEDFSLKGYDIAAQSIVELKDSSYSLLFVGASQGKQDEVAEILLQTGISKNQLIVRSFVKDKQRLRELFCEVDLAIMPSRTEGFGLTALEAMSAGLPILVSANSGFGKALRGLPMGESFVIDSSDPKEWAKAIAAIRHESRTQRLEEIQRLRRSYDERFSWERQCQALVTRMWKMVYGK
ncbi:unnamed protein product, partial [Porites evermanni]